MKLLACALLMGLAAKLGAAQTATPKTSLLVLAKQDQMLAIVDPASLQVVARVPVGPEPHEVIASADGHTAWVTNYLNGSEHTITIVDLLAQKVSRTVDLGPLWGPHGLYVAGGRTYFTAERAKAIGRLAEDGTSVDWVLGTGQTGTHMLWVSRDGSKIATVNVGSGTLTLANRKVLVDSDRKPAKLSKQGGIVTHGKGGPEEADWQERVVKVGSSPNSYPEGFDVLADTDGNPRTIWVANAREGTIAVVDWASGAVTRTIAAEVQSANRLRFTPDGAYALVSREKSGEVSVIRVADGSTVKRIIVGTGAAGVLIAPDGLRAYVSCSPDHWVAVIDLKTLTVVGKILPGTTPDGLAWAIQN